MLPLSFKSVKLTESVFTSQADIPTNSSICYEKFIFSNYSEADFEDLGNADLYIFNQDDKAFAYFGLVLMYYNIQATMRNRYA